MPAAVVQTSVIDARMIAARLPYKTFVPTYLREVRHARRVEQRQMPLLSRYFFAWIEPHEVGEVRRVKGVVDVLRKAGGDEPSYVREDILALLGEVETPGFTLGNKLRVVRGRMEGLEGMFHKDEDQRVFVMVSMLGREVAVPFARNELQKIRI